MPARAAIAVALLVALSGAARAADPLRCVPPSAQVVVVSDSPRKLAEAVTALDAFHAAQKLPQFRAAYNSAPSKRAFALLALFEKELGAKWPELLERLAGGGAALGFQLADDPAPTVLVLQGTDEEQVTRALDFAARLLDEERARQGSPERVTWASELGRRSTTIGDGHLTQVGPTVLLSNNPAMLKEAVARATAERAEAQSHKARKDATAVLPPAALAWLWVDLASVKQSKSSKDFFDATRQDFLQTLIAGGTIDCLKRADFVAAGLYREPAGFRLAVRLPAGRSAFPPEFQLHAPPKGTAGTLPLLEPPGTLYSHSLHLDVGFLWQNRAKLLNDETRGGLEKFDKDVSKVLPGSVKFGELLAMWRPHHRVVVANHDAPPYKTQPGRRLPAFGYVATGADPTFARSVEPVLRSAALLASLQFGLKMQEHTHDGAAIVAYRFPEGKELADDPDGLRFNFEPCFAVVGDELVVASTVELCKKLVSELKSPKGQSSPPVLRGRFSAAAAADALAGSSEPLVTDAILGRGVGLEQARKDVAALVAWVKTLGAVGVELDITDRQYKFDLVWNLGRP